MHVCIYATVLPQISNSVLQAMVLSAVVQGSQEMLGPGKGKNK